MNIKEVLRTNTYITGFIIALVAPVITLLLMIPLIRLIMQVTGNNHFVDNQGILLLGIIPNILFIRYFMVKAQDEKTAKGLMVITAILVILFFMFIHNHSIELPF
jgi:hypothetical protein